MLIFTHRPGETPIIESPAGERIHVTVLGITGNQVRICIQAHAINAYSLSEPLGYGMKRT